MDTKKTNNSKKVIIDTNFLLLPGQFKFDIFEEIQKVMNHKYELFIVDMTLEELENIKNSKAKVKDKVAVNIAKELLEIKKIKKISTRAYDDKSVDDLLVKISDENTIVCTNDKELKKRLLEKGIPIIEFMKKSYLRIKQK